jgi:hypothetical protein
MTDIKIPANAVIRMWDLDNPDAKNQYDLTNAASTMYGALFDIGEAIRSRLKYSPTPIPADEEKFLEELCMLVVEAIDKFS